MVFPYVALPACPSYSAKGGSTFCRMQRLKQLMGSEGPKDHTLLEVSETLDSPWRWGLYAQSWVTKQGHGISLVCRQMPSLCLGLFVYHSVWRRERGWGKSSRSLGPWEWLKPPDQSVFHWWVNDILTGCGGVEGGDIGGGWFKGGTEVEGNIPVSS